ncbi:hypothetical protein PR048_033573 [Dryococelus australis]|uniref:Uncharacterized protein n=1 Tax=Dryococelus australis TaxID=614101 RepID=A0ABQ9G0N4_9NEOP|nr:hypothetical protein PR048_033573 [Dryococelus australis]
MDLPKATLPAARNILQGGREGGAIPPYTNDAFTLITSHHSETGSIPGRFNPDFCNSDSCRTMPLVGGFSRVTPVSPTLSLIHSGSALYSPLFTPPPIGSQDLAAEGRPNLFTGAWPIRIRLLRYCTSVIRGCSPPTRRTVFDPQQVHSRVFACGSRAGRCRWSAGFLGDLPFPLPLHSGAAPYTPRFTRIGSQDLADEAYSVAERVGVECVARNSCVCYCRRQPATEKDGGWINYFPPTYAKRVRFPADSLLDFRTWKSCRTIPLVELFDSPVRGVSRGSPPPPPCIPGAAPYSPHFALTGSQDLDVEGRPNLFTPETLITLYSYLLSCSMVLLFKGHKDDSQLHIPKKESFSHNVESSAGIVQVTAALCKARFFFSGEFAGFEGNSGNFEGGKRGSPVFPRTCIPADELREPTKSLHSLNVTGQEHFGNTISCLCSRLPCGTTQKEKFTGSHDQQP